MIEKIFVDSNVWIYLFTSNEVSKNEVAKNFISENYLNNNILVVSFQVLNEVASALEAKCNKLSSEDMQHGQAISGIIIHNIFRY